MDPNNGEDARPPAEPWSPDSVGLGGDGDTRRTGTQRHNYLHGQQSSFVHGLLPSPASAILACPGYDSPTAALINFGD